MSIEVVKGSNDKPEASRLLVQSVEDDPALSGCLFVGYPIIATAEGRHCVDALLVSPDSGITVFDLIEGEDAEGFGIRQDDTANLVEARLRVHRELLSGRSLRVPIHTLSFAPAATGQSSGGHSLCRDAGSLIRELKHLEWDASAPAVYQHALSALENVSGIRSAKSHRVVESATSRGAKLVALEKSIETLDDEQNRAVIETVEGIQRIRGLAGSGKTIVLALKAAYLHAQHPDWRIAVTFYTRSLKDMYRRHIERFHFRHANEPPDWESVRVVNTWGGGWDDQAGLYYEYCDAIGVQPLNFGEASKRFCRSELFAGACKEALSHGRSAPIYDAILVDEAQDSPPEFLRLCWSFLKEPRRLVYAYDELQNLERESLPPPERIFGQGPDGQPRVVLGGDSQDIVLKKCYRNSGPVLTAAHALGFGVYRKAPEGKATGLVQMFDNQELWEEVGYKVMGGRLGDGNEVTLVRTADTSPTFLADHSPRSDLIEFKAFDTPADQAQWLADEIQKNIHTDELRPSDIMVVHPEPLTARKAVAQARALLFESRIDTYLAGVDRGGDVFWPREEAVVFSSVHRAKGNEAAMVYVVDAHECQSGGFNLAGYRNRLFAAITRSKAWVRVAGVGPRMHELSSEFNRVVGNGFALTFRYPTVDERKNMRMAHRDRTTSEANRLSSRNRQLADLIASVEKGDLTVDDLDPEVVAKLRGVLKDPP